MAESGALQGWWKIVSFQVETQGGGERVSPYGEKPLGCLVFAEGRMAALLSSSEPAEADPSRFNTTMAYSGACKVEDGRKLVVQVDAALFPSWIGSEQARNFEIDGDTLHVTSDWRQTPMFRDRLSRSVMTFRRP